jgi:hypothetical protein
MFIIEGKAEAKALFPICREIHPHCKPRGLKRVFLSEDGGNMFL